MHAMKNHFCQKVPLRLHEPDSLSSNSFVVNTPLKITLLR